MKNTKNMGKKIAATVLALGILTTGAAAFAAEVVVKSPAEIAASVTGKTITAVQEERAAGKTYGTIAKDAKRLEEFKGQILENKKAYLDAQVKAGKMTQEKATELYNRLKEAQLTCTGDGSAQIGRNAGAGFGSGMSGGQGMRDGSGMGRASGGGVGTRDGSGTGRGAGMGGRFANR